MDGGLLSVPWEGGCRAESRQRWEASLLRRRQRRSKSHPVPNHDDALGATGLWLVLLFCVTAARDHEFSGSQ